MANKSYTILVVPDRSAATRKFRVQAKLLVRIAWASGIFGLLLVAMVAHYFLVVGQVGENRVLSEENAQLRTQLKLVHERVGHISQTLDRVERFDQKLRALTQLNDPERNLAIGPLPADDRQQGEEDPEEAASGHKGLPEDTAFLPSKLDSLAAEATGDEQSIQQLTRYFEDQKNLLASTPSLWPARGWVTSDFGIRTDPYTSERSMHRGLDIANEIGTPVVAPSDGVVIFDGTEGGYGNVLVARSRVRRPDPLRTSLQDSRQARRQGEARPTGRGDRKHWSVDWAPSALRSPDQRHSREPQKVHSGVGGPNKTLSLR